MDLPKLRALWEAGVTRLSVGVQAVQDRLLRRIGRVHTASEAEQAFRLMREAGFDNINLDLMFGLPGQSMGDWVETLDWAIGVGPEHISAYGLILEEGTPLYQEHREGEIGLPDEETEAMMYQMAVDRLRDAGFEQYEISNFACPAFVVAIIWSTGNTRSTSVSARERTHFLPDGGCITSYCPHATCAPLPSMEQPWPAAKSFRPRCCGPSA